MRQVSARRSENGQTALRVIIAARLYNALRVDPVSPIPGVSSGAHPSASTKQRTNPAVIEPACNVIGRFAPEAAGHSHLVRNARSSMSKAARSRNADFGEPDRVLVLVHRYILPLPIGQRRGARRQP